MSSITTLNDWISGASFRWQVNTNFSNLNADKAELSGGTFTGDISVPAEVYGAGWNGSNEVPTKNDLYDKIETISGGGSVATDAIWDAKGDLAVGTGANTASRLAVGTNGQILVADSAEATGVKWANASGGGDMLAATYDPANIAEQVVGLTATQTFSAGVKTFLAGMFGLRNVANTFTSFFTNTNTASRTYTLQDSSDTLVGRATTDTLTNKTLTSPTLTTPVLGTPSSGTLTNCTGTATGLTSGITNALKSATTTVDVSAATAPTSGQVLTATSWTAATWQTPSGWAGWLTRDVWYALTWTYASTTTFTTTEASGAEATRLAGIAERALFTCTNAAGSTRRIGYIKSASAASTTVTYTVVTDSDLASGDISFKITPDRAVEDYKHLISIPGELIADASNPQGLWLLNVKRDAYLLPVCTAVRTAAAGSGAACAYNVYKGATNLFTTAPDMTTATTLNDQRPNTNTISSGDNVSLRITSSAGATNKASDFQAELFIVPQKLYTSQ